MTTLAPVSVALKFGFLGSALPVPAVGRAQRAARPAQRVFSGARLTAAGAPVPADATGLHSASAAGVADLRDARRGWWWSAPLGHDPGMIYDLDEDVVLGRGDRAEIRLEDPFASSRHARIYRQGNILVIEDLRSTNGTYLNEELLGPRAAASRRSRQDRRHGVHVRGGLMLRVAEQYAATDTGRQRRANEDSLLARSPLFVVADGMGGAQAGEVASRLAVDVFEEGLGDTTAPERGLAQRAGEANSRIHELSHSNAEHAGMGTTLTAVYVGARGDRDRPRRGQPRLSPARTASSCA